MEYKNFKVVYRRYATLYFIVAIDNEEVSLFFEGIKLLVVVDIIPKPIPLSFCAVLLHIIAEINEFGVNPDDLITVSFDLHGLIYICQII